MFPDTRINRISYDYASTFWDFLVSGGTDAEAAFKDYPNVAKFITKPKNDSLPANFNTFYGPRIVKQLGSVIAELKRSPNTRRATLMILNEDDLQLLDKDETLEFPCTIAYHLTRRNGKLILSTVMRSQNLAVVLQLDVYLQIRLLHLVAAELGIDIKDTEYHCHMINGHVFERDFDYVRGFLD
jgi:thymidylate synthase